VKHNKFFQMALTALILVSVIPFSAVTNISTAWADDGAQPAPENETTLPEEGQTSAAEADAEAAPEEQPAADVGVEAPAEDEPAEAPEAILMEEETSVENEAEPAPQEAPQEMEATDVIEEVEGSAVETSTDTGEETDAVSEELQEASDPAALPSEDESTPTTEEETVEVAQVVQALEESNMELVNAEGDSVPMASNEAAYVISGLDPFFWNGINWEGYAQSVDACPDNVQCTASVTPFQSAVDNAADGYTLYVAEGYYDEDIVVNTPNLAFVGFQAVTIPDAGASTITIDASGYAVVKSLTLNEKVNVDDSSGVYSPDVIVNETPANIGGRLSDAMELVNVGGTIEASIDLYSADNHYRVRDINDHNTNFEWECGEPDESIYPGRQYRMILKDRFNLDILDYYTSTQGDERSGLDLSAEERLEDVVIGINLSEDYDFWSHKDEEQIFWYLLGNNVSLTAPRQNSANAITDGSNDDVTRFWDMWFMWPKQELVNGPKQAWDDFQAVSPENRQLTFFMYDPRPFYNTGCTDPGALNYDPNADIDNGLCAYESITETPPADTPVLAALPIPVTGAADGPQEQLLIPVTGLDLSAVSAMGGAAAGLWSAVGLIAFGLTIVISKKEQKH